MHISTKGPIEIDHVWDPREDKHGLAFSFHDYMAITYSDGKIGEGDFAISYRFISLEDAEQFGMRLIRAAERERVNAELRQFELDYPEGSSQRNDLRAIQGKSRLVEEK